MNPRWIAYGDVRLSLVVGFGLAWVSPMALVDGFFYANLMAAVVGLVLIGLHRAKRGSALPFGLYLGLWPLHSSSSSGVERRSGGRPSSGPVRIARATPLAASPEVSGSGVDGSADPSRWRSDDRVSRRVPRSTLSAIEPVAGPSVSAKPSAMARYSSPVNSTSCSTSPSRLTPWAA